MKRFLLFLILFVSTLPVIAQPAIREKKYTSLLWEITGNGLRKPSYLIGTMHVSSKIAFNLPDSFYFAVRNAQVVALETNPETWQEDMNKYDLYGTTSMQYNNYYSTIPSDYLNINTLKFFPYNTKIARALYSNPSTINNLLYRSYGNESSDFEEDTYLDMYIYQCGKKWGKRVAGVEDYGESMKLMAEAYRDAARDKNRKLRGFVSDEDYSLEKLQEAYRMGNLDVLDSINRYNSVSAAFDEKFLYERNRIQARNIDSILRSGTSLFVGVGAAHLPGDRGVIEILRKSGYRLRPVKMGERSGKQKELVDKIRVPVTFSTYNSTDGFFKVDVPGKLYKLGEDPGLEQHQYADMANGSYYMITRMLTNAWMWDHSPEKVYKSVDSLLYENVPGKIISKTQVTRNGYKGIDIVNRTRRGDMQRYQIFITPFEILFFKMSGNGDYVTVGEEARKFFGSIQLRDMNATANGWKKFSPSYGGFSVEMPHTPYTGNDGSWIFDAEEKGSDNHYRVMRTDINNFSFVGEDTFDLRLMEESFADSEFIDSVISRRETTHQGYPALEVQYRGNNNRVFNAKFIIQGPHYYSLITDASTAGQKRFFDSFSIIPLVYRPARTETDTMLYYTVKTPVYNDDEKISLGIRPGEYFGYAQDEEESEEEQLESGAFRNRVVKSDSTGEKIYITFYRYPSYYYTADSVISQKVTYMNDSTWIVRWRKRQDLPGGLHTSEAMVTDTASSRILYGKAFYRNGVYATLVTQLDTITAPSDFVRTFYETFSLSDTVTGTNPYTRKSKLFFEDFHSTDSARHKRAVKHIGMIDLDSTDLNALKKAIASVNWEEKNYLSTKSALINKFGSIKSKEASQYLKQLYYQLDDTVQLQYPVLENLLQQKTAYAYGLFRDIITQEPPVIASSTGTYDYDNIRTRYYDGSDEYKDGEFLDELSDSLELTKTILPGLLPLLNLEDYKAEIMSLLETMADSNLLKPDEYAAYFDKLLIEAKLELKKQSIAEKRKAILKAEKEKSPVNDPYRTNVDEDRGNEDLGVYATLLQQFWDAKTAVQPLLRQMLSSGDNKLKYRTMLLMIRNNRLFPDTLLNYFAGLDQYRVELYSDLKQLNKLKLFPSQHNNHIALARSALFSMQSYNRPDSIGYIDRTRTSLGGREGYVYFFRYRENKDDAIWKIAVAGLTPLDEKTFSFDEPDYLPSGLLPEYLRYGNGYRYQLTSFTQTKLKEDEPIRPQLEKELKKILYGRKKSGREFYKDNSNPYGNMDYYYGN